MKFAKNLLACLSIFFGIFFSLFYEAKTVYASQDILEQLKELNLNTKAMVQVMNSLQINIAEMNSGVGQMADSLEKMQQTTHNVESQLTQMNPVYVLLITAGVIGCGVLGAKIVWGSLKGLSKKIYHKCTSSTKDDVEAEKDDLQKNRGDTRKENLLLAAQNPC